MQELANIESSDRIKDLIYTVRGVKVMLDSDLADIYGYTTKTLNQQVKNNIAKFDDDFRFQLTKEEYHLILRSKKLTSKYLMDSNKSESDEMPRSKNLTIELGSPRPRFQGDDGCRYRQQKSDRPGEK